MSLYSDIKAKWQRFNQWEHIALLREKEWRFPIDGTAADFEQRFNYLIPSSSPDEFFNMRKRRKTSGLSGFCKHGEIAVNVPNPRPTATIDKLLRSEASIYYFHGSLNQDHGGLYLYGHFRLPHKIARGILSMINSSVFYSVFFIVATAAFGIELLDVPVSAHFLHSALVSLLPYFALFFVLISLTNWLLVRNLVNRDRHAREETYRLLAEICGSPAQPSTAHSE